MNKVPKRPVTLRPRMSHHKHSFKRRPHGETSYALLAFLTILAAVVLAAFSSSSFADQTDPQSGTLSLTTAVLAQPPSYGAIISLPGNGQVFTEATITVSGSCVPGSLVKVYKNNVFAGSGLCSLAGRYSFQISLFSGTNVLSAGNYDAADQAGPATTSVTVQYRAPASPAVANKVIAPILIDGPTNLRGYYVGEVVPWPIGISGGLGPYAVNFDWGDGSNNVYSRNAPGRFDTEHTYKQHGPNQDSYTVTVTVTDSVGNQQVVRFVVIVRDRSSALLTTANKQSGQLSIAWPALGLVLLMIGVFWVGEKVTDLALLHGGGHLV